MLTVARYRFGATFRRRWGGYLAIALLIGLVGGVAMGSIAAARRTQSSYPAFLASTNASDLTMSTYGVNAASGARLFGRVDARDRAAPRGQAGRGLGGRRRRAAGPTAHRILNSSLNPVGSRRRPVLQRGPRHPRRRSDGGSAPRRRVRHHRVRCSRAGLARRPGRPMGVYTSEPVRATRLRHAAWRPRAGST